MNLRQWFIDFFGFSQKEANGILVLLVLIIFLAILPRFFSARFPDNSASDSLLLAEWYSQVMEAKMRDTVKNNQFTERRNVPSRELISKKTRIEAPVEKVASVPIEKSDINTATREQLMEIRGIGEVLGERIVKFRDQLGGFYDLSQVRDVYGLKPEVVDEIVKRFEVQSPIRPTIYINSDSLIRHPMISYKLARSISNFRKTHGNYQDATTLLEIKGLSDSLYQKIYPYISIQPIITD